MEILNQGIWGFIGNLAFGLFFILLLYSVFISLREKEKRAANRLFFLLVVSIILASLVNYLTVSMGMVVVWPILTILISLVFLAVLFPWREQDIPIDQDNEGRIDERTIMFSRAELVPGTDRFDEYYKQYPEHKEADDSWRKSPGLLHPDSGFYHPFLFNVADATFYTVSGLHAKTDGPVNSVKDEWDKEALDTFLKNWAKKLGCHSIGVCELKDKHLYTTGGRSHNYNEVVENIHSKAIAFTVEMGFDRVASAPRGPIIVESANQYLNAGVIAVQLAAFLRNLGFSAKAHIDGKYQVRCPQVARDAGLGELGRMGLLMTPGLGPRVRIGVVTTDAPLPIVKKTEDKSVIRFCEICKKCADTCPAQAISFDDRKVTNGALQWNIAQEKCFGYWCQVGTDCGRCISVCPYSHPDNLLHNIIRKLIRRAPVFRRLAYHLDDWLYGRKPPSRDLPDWMNAKN